MRSMGRGTARRRRVVEGSRLLGEGNNTADYGVEIVQDFVRRNSQNPKSPLLKPRVARLIEYRPIATRMRFSIDFDDQLCAKAVKIGDIGSSGVLTTKFQAGRASA
jgi:hypothetical protein